MAKVIDNKELIQSYVVTTAKYDFSIYEKRILYRIIELIQGQIEGKKLTGKIEPRLFGDYLITMPISAFLTKKDDKNYNQIRNALIALRNKSFEYEDEDQWKLIGIIEKPRHNKYDSMVTFEVQPEIYDALLNFTKGYRKYELKIAMSFNSVYSMRLYELVSNQKRPITYSINKLREMFNLGGKYSQVGHFKARVIDVAKKELDEKSPYTFAYKLNKTGRKYTSITIVPIEQPKNKDAEIEKRNLLKQTSTRFLIPQELKLYLMEQFDFTEKQIKNNIELISKANQLLDIYDLLTSKKRNILDSKNKQGYLITVLKDKIQPNL